MLIGRGCRTGVACLGGLLGFLGRCLKPGVYRTMQRFTGADGFFMSDRILRWLLPSASPGEYVLQVRLPKHLEHLSNTDGPQAV